MWKKDGVILRGVTEINGNVYGTNWFEQATPEQLAELGVYWEDPPAKTPEEIAAEAESAYQQTVPRTVTMRQARIALLQAGLLTTVNGAVAAMTGVAGEAARIEWEYSTEVHRDRALVQSLGAALGLSSRQLDDLFFAAQAVA